MRILFVLSCAGLISCCGHRGEYKTNGHHGAFVTGEAYENGKEAAENAPDYKEYC